MTIQEMFDKVWDHFIVQGNPPGYDAEGENCIYSGPPCAVGCLMSPEARKRLEGYVGAVYSVYTDDRPALEEIVGYKLPDIGSVYRADDERIPLEVRFLDAIQVGHDANACDPLDTFRAKFQQSLTHIARDWKLTLPEGASA